MIFTARSLRWDKTHHSRDLLLTREWLVTNGLGGFASGTISGAITRRYHGLLIAALPAPNGRMVMWNHVSERLRFDDGETISLGAEERAGGQLDLGAADYLHEFRLENGLPIWTYHVRDLVIEKRVLLLHRQNTVHLTYRILRGEKRPALELRPAFSFRHYETAVNEGPAGPYQLTAIDHRYEITAPHTDLPPLRMRAANGEAEFTVSPHAIHQVAYRIEQSRGYAFEGDLWSPGFFHIDLREHDSAALIASTETWDIIDVLSPANALAAESERRAKMLDDAVPEARAGFPAELVFAADDFIITPAGRAEEAARAHAAGDEVRTVIAGYHWFTDWGRDTMISLEGLTLVTGRCLEAGYILRTFAHYVRHGLIPNMFPDGKKGGLYHTVDATLWFFHALSRYLEYTDDQTTLRLLLPTLINIAEYHLRGTRFNIHVDPHDGLLAQGEEGFQLTWMDAKMGDWVVTPRRGKAVEINALWYNALELLARWCGQSGDLGGEEKYSTCAKQTRHSFNERFWFAEGGYLYDVVDCNGESGTADPSCRPNQIFAISLDHPVLEQERWASVMKVAQEKLLTTVGLRSLSPDHPDYKPIYSGDLRSRDGAYHQGTVWAWLIGPFIDAWLKVHPNENKTARHFLTRFPEHLDDDGLGTISEVFDAREPHHAGGCIAQAWSVAEVLRSWLKTA
ncbi:MAG: glycogen debranching enzyme N-terminal domain-containing protein [Verrucomicrobia bacterium]|nr:glycogen debranching enzyme N-terminal domain-containing protein [Verrucomicrobiota bacterium]